MACGKCHKDAVLWKFKELAYNNHKMLVVKINKLIWAKIWQKMASFCPIFMPNFKDEKALNSVEMLKKY